MDKLLTKKDWALYCHEYLLNVLHEADEEDWSAARALKDIYDCHTCVYHIAQVYVKGIIPAQEIVGSEGALEFGGDFVVSKEESDLYLRRLTNKEERLKVENLPLPQIKKITIDEIFSLKNAKLIDVRPEQTFKSIYQNPFIVSEDLFQPIVLMCERGYKSTILADLLLSAGYKSIYISTTNSL